MGKQWVRAAAAAVVALGLGAQARAAVTIVNSGILEQSVLSASAFDGNSGSATTNSVSVTTLPSTPTVSAAQGVNTSSVTGDLSQAAFKIGMNQFISIVNPNAETTGTADLYFKSTTNLTFTSSGDFTTQIGVVVGQFFPGSISFEMGLFDVTTGHTVFDVNQFGNIGDKLTVSPQSGTIVAGDTYEFLVDAAMFPIADPTGVVTASLNFAPIAGPGGGGGSSVPLPPAVWAGMLTAAGVMGYSLRRKATMA